MTYEEKINETEILAYEEKINEIDARIRSSLKETFWSYRECIEDLITLLHIAMKVDDDELRDDAISIVMYTIFGAIQHSNNR